jgi:hypothetical protein
VSDADELAWYAAFGTNLSRARMACYVAGGRPRGAARSYEGCRDPTPPRLVRTLTVPGSLRFAGESGVWGGGMAFFTPGDEGLVRVRAYLLRVEQLGDLVAQETRHPVGRSLELAATGPTRHGMSDVYDVVLDVGELDGQRLLTLTSSREHPVNPPSAAYVRTMLDGLADGFGMDAEARVSYLAAIDGVRPRWTLDGLRRLLADDPRPPGA